MVAASLDTRVPTLFVWSRLVTRAVRVLGSERVPLKKSTRAEAPRPARDRIDGRSPGSRVAACHRLPGYLSPSGAVAQARRLQLRGQLRHWNPRSAPHSLSLSLRETVDGMELRGRIRALSMHVGSEFLGPPFHCLVPDLIAILIKDQLGVFRGREPGTVLELALELSRPPACVSECNESLCRATVVADVAQDFAARRDSNVPVDID